MRLTRTQLREKIMVILYQVDFYEKEKIDYDLEDVIKENLEIDNKFVRDIVSGCINNKENIDNKISKYLDGWDLDRLGKTDKAILRMAVFEMNFYNTPSIVVINEAIELSKKYSDEKVVKIINAVLDKIKDEEEEE